MIQVFTRAGIGQGPDPIALDIAIKGAATGVTSITVQGSPGSYNISVDKATNWTSPQITAVQNAINGVADVTTILMDQAYIDKMPKVEKAIILSLLDQINLIRSKLVPPLGAITPAQVVAAVRVKVGEI